MWICVHQDQYNEMNRLLNMQERVIKIAQDAVDQLQLDVKYLIFDLEATKRERDEAQEALWEDLEG